MTSISSVSEVLAQAAKREVSQLLPSPRSAGEREG